jgi:lysyl-tRNA synthetase class 2
MPVVTERQDKHLPAREPGGDQRADGQHPPRPAGPAGSGRLAPAIAGWLSVLVGLADIAGQLAAELPGRYPQLARGLHEAGAVMPGAGLATAARVAGVITGLLLLMLSHGLRRRKHRAWQGVTALLAGDPRSRWRALRVLPALLAADTVIGLAFIALSRDLAGSYGFGQRLQSVAFGLAGVSGPVRFLVQDRGDLFAATTGPWACSPPW